MVDHLVEQEIGKLFPRAVQRLPQCHRRDRLAQLQRKAFRHFRRMQLRVVAPKTQHRVQRRTTAPLELGKPRPRARQQVVAPTGQERAIRIGQRRRSKLRLGIFFRQGARQALAALLVIRNQVKEYPLDEIAQTSALGIGAAQRAAQQPQGELLEELLDRFRVAHHALQIPTDGSSVALQ